MVRRLSYHDARILQGVSKSHDRVSPPSFLSLSDSIGRARRGARLPAASVLLRGLATLSQTGGGLRSCLPPFRHPELSLIYPSQLHPPALLPINYPPASTSSSLKTPYDFEFVNHRSSL